MVYHVSTKWAMVSSYKSKSESTWTPLVQANEYKNILLLKITLLLKIVLQIKVWEMSRERRVNHERSWDKNSWIV